MPVKSLLIDIDGVLYEKNALIPGALETLEYLKKKSIPFVLVTNISRMPKKDILSKLRATGLVVDEDKVLTAVTATTDYVNSRKKNAKCFLISEKSTEEDFIQAGLEVTRKEEPVDFVILGVDTKTDFNSIDAAFRLIDGGAEFVAVHEDKSVVTDRKHVSLGVFVKGLEYSTGKKAAIIGKPNRNFFYMGMKKISAKAEETAMVGDSLSGDIIGAKNAGLKTIMVRTGNFKEEEVNKSETKPDFIIDSIKDLPGHLERVNGKGN